MNQAKTLTCQTSSPEIENATIATICDDTGISDDNDTNGDTITAFLKELDPSYERLYGEIFERERITISILAEMTHADLKELEVSTFGARHTMLKAAKSRETLPNESTPLKQNAASSSTSSASSSTSFRSFSRYMSVLLYIYGIAY